MKRAITSSAALTAILFLATIGCQAQPQASSTPKKSATAAPALPKEPVVFVPPESSGATGNVGALKEADERFKDYTLNATRAQIELREVSVTVLNKMEGFTEPVTSSTPGRYEFGGQGRTVSQDERNKVSEQVRKSTVAYLEKRLLVTKGAHFEVVVVISAGLGVRILNGFDPYGIEIFRTFLIDTSTKAVIWCDGREGYGKTLDAATKVAASGVPERLAVLFGSQK